MPSYTSSAPALSRSSSYTPSPHLSLSTPPLIRSDSHDSSTMQPTTPTTPSFYFPPPENPLIYNNGFQDVHWMDVQQKEAMPHFQSMHPAIGYSIPPGFLPQMVPREAVTTPASKPRKNSYPCPLAKEYNCSDHFTTSGHAARHSKKHTGKKDAMCPECNKTFTRKDNMEQHRRTHSSGRNAPKGNEGALKKAKTQSKRPRPYTLQSSTPAVPSLSVADQTPQYSPAHGSFTRSSYPDPTPYSLNPSYQTPVSSYGGLDALAMAAAGYGPDELAE
jgi:hypothetical protein